MSNGSPQSHSHAETVPAMSDEAYFDVPNVARIYDYYLGGKDNFPRDREAARGVLRIAPDVPLAALENREFLGRAIRFLVEEAGIRQFIDIGPGLPTQGNVHHIAKRHDPGSRIVYVDNDPVVLAHGRALLHHSPGVAIINGDLREPADVLANPELQALVDLSGPVALCMSLVLQFLPDADDPYGVVTWLAGNLCPGSYLALTHVTGDERDAATMGGITDIYDEATTPLIPRTRSEVSRFFAVSNWSNQDWCSSHNGGRPPSIPHKAASAGPMQVSGVRPQWSSHGCPRFEIDQALVRSAQPL
jgi:S-adenosyl methyltransferase